MSGPLQPRILSLDTPVQYVKGIGPKRAELLAREGIITVGDLYERPPFRYEDRTEFRPVRMLREGEMALIRATVCGAGSFQARRGSFSILELLVKDDSGGISVKFFNRSYLRSVYAPGVRLVIYGQVKRDSYARGTLCLMNPECELLSDDETDPVHSGRIVPIYRRIGDLRARALRQLMHNAIAAMPSGLPDPLPEYLRRRLRLQPRAQALVEVHFPSAAGTLPEERIHVMEALNRGMSPSHKRLIFEELFLVQAGIRMVRQSRLILAKSRQIELKPAVREAIKRILPFHPTAAQKRVLREIADDMRSSRPMHRLLQGDVGSGKTIVAAQAAVIAVENGYQVAVMAPTEILAEQHHFYFSRLLAPLGYPMDLLKGSLRVREKQEAQSRLRTGITRIAIGTHALIQEGVEFRSLALAIVDEQHRFGVAQRSALMAKGNHPDVLVMTATPIPRSLALTLYGDLDVSVIDEMPPRRKPIITRWCSDRAREEIYVEIRRTIDRGEQVYVVYPLIEESQKSDLRAATEMAEHLRTTVFRDVRVGLLHGKMKSMDKEEVMAEFAGGKIPILVSTTVIEVGVDVANATLMVVEHAERFGLAQLHQLRGRIGRGAAQSCCLLVGDAQQNPEARQRLDLLCATNDGFRIAEADLEMRGPGEIAGTRQSGIPLLRYANLARDRRILEVAREEADQFIELARRKPDEDCRRTLAHIRRCWKDRFGLALVG